MSRTNNLPLIPALSPGLPAWPATVESAYNIVQTRHQQACHLLDIDNGDLPRLRVAKATLETECVTTMFDLETFGLPESFIDAVLDVLASTVVQLEHVISTLNDG
jgi:hypothetical protein